MRLYRGELLRSIRFSPAYDDMPAYFQTKLFDEGGYHLEGIYQADTIEAILDQIRAKGHQIWGKDLLDYAIPPKNALEYILFTAELLRQGYTQQQIDEMFRIDLKERQKE